MKIAALSPVSDHNPVLAKYFDISVPAGFPSPAQDYMEEEINLQQLLIPKPLSTFIMRVKGDSMKDAFIADNALIVVDRSIQADSGMIIVAVVNGEFTVKRLIKTPRTWVLHPDNPLYKPIPITDEMQFEVWGVVTKIIMDAK